MKTSTTCLFTALALLILSGLRVPAQPYSVDWFKVSGGGGTSTNAQYALSGTVGQHDAGGPMTGGNYSVTGGFWGLVAVVQTPGALLTITRSGNSVIISWPSPSPGFSPMQNTDLANPNGWTPYVGPISDNGTVKSITVTRPTGNLFFRLKK
jgi:hypothetical protein